MFYDIFKQLSESKGISVHKASLELGLSKSTATKWKKTAATPNGDTLQKIAEYFDVSIEYLLTGNNSEQKNNSQQETESLTNIGSVYLSMAKKMQDAGIHPDDIEYFIELNKRARERNDKK